MGILAVDDIGAPDELVEGESIEIVHGIMVSCKPDYRGVMLPEQEVSGRFPRAGHGMECKPERDTARFRLILRDRRPTRI